MHKKKIEKSEIQRDRHGDVKKFSSSPYHLRDGFIIFIQGGIVPTKAL